MKIKIVVIDNGIDSQLLQVLFPINYDIECLQIMDKKYVKQDRGSKHNDHHGTLCIAILLEHLYNKKLLNYVEIISISISDNEGRKNLNAMCSALEWCINENVDLILMSVGIKIFNYAKKLQNVLKRAEEKKIIIVAATANNYEITYPACFREVIGVKCLENYNYNKKEIVVIKKPIDGIEIAAFGMSSVLDKYNNNFNHHYSISNSFVVPIVATSVCMILKKEGRRDKEYILKAIADKYTVSDFSYPQIKKDSLLPIIGIFYEKNKKINLRQHMYNLIDIFEKKGYACACITDIQDAADFENNIFYLDIISMNKMIDYYQGLLLRNNSVILLVLEDKYENIYTLRLDEVIYMKSTSIEKLQNIIHKKLETEYI